MACRNAYKTKMMKEEAEVISASISEPVSVPNVDRLLFGVDSKIQANDLLQNNIEEFEWVVRNKIYPISMEDILSVKTVLLRTRLISFIGRAVRSQLSTQMKEKR